VTGCKSFVVGQTVGQAGYLVPTGTSIKIPVKKGDMPVVSGIFCPTGSTINIETQFQARITLERHKLTGEVFKAETFNSHVYNTPAEDGYTVSRDDFPKTKLQRLIVEIIGQNCAPRGSLSAGEQGCVIWVPTPGRTAPTSPGYYYANSTNEFFCPLSVNSLCAISDVVLNATALADGKLSVKVRVATGHFDTQAAAIGATRLNKALKTARFQDLLAKTFSPSNYADEGTRTFYQAAVTAAKCNSGTGDFLLRPRAYVQASICGKEAASGHVNTCCTSYGYGLKLLNLPKY
jgi:hypothetical protein